MANCLQAWTIIGASRFAELNEEDGQLFQDLFILMPINCKVLILLIFIMIDRSFAQ
jgi:hypothetical protein